MLSNSNGNLRAGGEKLNQYALVVYVPDPLARFLDDLRRELVKGCRPRAHTTVLPPRPLAEPEAAREQVKRQAAEFAPFELEAGDIEIFPKTNVIFIGIGRGRDCLLAMHDAMNTGALAFDEPFPYHPHITLAQDFEAGELPGLAALARERWEAYRGPRSFLADRVAFVQNTVGNCWLDLAEVELPAKDLEKLRG